MGPPALPLGIPRRRLKVPPEATSLEVQLCQMRAAPACASAMPRRHAGGEHRRTACSYSISVLGYPCTPAPRDHHVLEVSASVPSRDDHATRSRSLFRSEARAGAAPHKSMGLRCIGAADRAEPGGSASGFLLRLRYSTRIAKFACGPGECNIWHEKREVASRCPSITSRTFPPREGR